MNQWLKFGKMAVLDCLNIINDLDLDCGDPKGTLPKQKPINPHYGLTSLFKHCSSAFPTLRGFSLFDGGNPILQIIPLEDISCHSLKIFAQPNMGNP